MAMVRKSFTLTEQQDQWLKARMASGHYGNESEIIRELIRERELQHYETPEQIVALRRALNEGMESGPPVLMSKEQIIEYAKSGIRDNE